MMQDLVVGSARNNNMAGLTRRADTGLYLMKLTANRELVAN